MTAKPCRCHELWPYARDAQAVSHLLHRRGHDRRCPQYQPRWMKGRFTYKRPLVAPLRRLVGKRRDRRRPTRPR